MGSGTEVLLARSKWSFGQLVAVQCCAEASSLLPSCSGPCEVLTPKDIKIEGFQSGSVLALGSMGERSGWDLVLRFC